MYIYYIFQNSSTVYIYIYVCVLHINIFKFIINIFKLLIFKYFKY